MKNAKTANARFNRDEILNSIKLNGTYDGDITPSPNYLLVTQDTGYKPYQALNDIIDNSLDADASSINITIGQEDKKPFIIISDNGIGMDVDILLGSMVLGASTEELQSKNKECEDGTQGRFGTGLKTSIATYQGKSYILSKTNGGDVYRVEYNIQQMANNGGYRVPVNLATDEEVQFFNEQTKNSKHGTVIKIYDIKNFNCSAINSQKSTMTSSIGQTFRRFIHHKKCSFTMNGRVVYATDPMSYMIPLEDGKLTFKSEKVKTEEIFNLEYIDSNGTLRKDGWAKLTAYRLPDIDAGLVKKSGFGSIVKSGFYILRNNREVMEAQTLGLFSRNTELTGMRIELEFLSDIDSTTKPNYAKFLFLFSEYFLNRIRPWTKSTVNKFRKDYKVKNPSKKSSQEQKNYNERFINHMKKLKPLLPTLPSLDPTKKKTKPSVTTGRKNKSYEPKDNIVISYSPMGEFGKAWEGFLLDDTSRKVELIINEDHRLNTDFMVNAEPKLLGVVQSMMASLTYAKWCNIPDGDEGDTYIAKWEQIESTFGSVLKQILDGVPQ